MKAINISKINDGIFVGDQMVGTNLRIITEFKISHLINTSGSQIQSTYETAGFKHLIFNWPEYPSGNNILIKDETAKKILNFIDDSIKKGNGVIIFSVKGQNRACVAIIIYLMKKYNWSMKKCRDYLSTKKKDIFINKNFINQLRNFEERLIKLNNKTLVSNWIDSKDENELLMKNTYLNEMRITRKKYLMKKYTENYVNNKENNENDKNDKNEIIGMKPHIRWADHINSDQFGKNYLTLIDVNKDLFLQKNVQPMINHILMQPKKSCMKNNNKNDYNELEENEKDKKKETEENNEGNNKEVQMLKNFFTDNDKPVIPRKLTYDDKDNFIQKENLIDNNITSNNNTIIENRNKNINNINENEKNINLNRNNNRNKFNEQEYIPNLSQKQINNYMNNDKYSKYFFISNQKKKIRAISANKDKNSGNSKLSQNKKYYLGSNIQKKFKENEKDIIPKINRSSQRNNSYDKMLVKNIINSYDIKNKTNNSMGNNLSYSKKKKNNHLMYKNNYKIIHKPKNAKIFSNFNSYNFQPSEPIKIGNNITYKLSNSVDKNSNNFMSTDNKIFNNLNTYATISKAMNMKNDNKVNNYYHNRPLSAQKNSIKNGINNNLYFNNSNGFKSNYKSELFHSKQRAPSPATPKSVVLKNIHNHYNNLNPNNRYRLSSPYEI